MQQSRKDFWAAGDLYEPYVGRWSRVVAGEFLGWLAVPSEKPRERIRAKLPFRADGSIHLIARAWTVEAKTP